MLKDATQFVVVQLNTNSFRTRFEQLSAMVGGNIEIFMIFKLNETFPTEQFSLQDFCKPDRFDRNRNDGDIILYIREDITSRLI